MYIPKLYKSEDDSLMKKIIDENGFALLISGGKKILATHAVFLSNENENGFFVETHISKANLQAQTMKEGDEVLCDFLGAHCYISSSWYDHQNVSTWNYEAVQIRGKVALMNENELYDHLKRMTFKYEKIQQCPFLVENMQDEFVRKEMKGAFGIKIIPTEISIADKISQNRDEKNKEKIIEKLQESGEINALKIAEKMQKLAK